MLALELKTDVALLDDLKARKTARRLKVTVMGTLAVLKVFLDLKLVREKPEDLCQQHRTRLLDRRGIKPKNTQGKVRLTDK